MKESFRITRDIQRAADPLLNQQMWCWGCDVRHTRGNLLVVYGAEKRSSPDARYHSAYTFQIGEDAVLNLWSWGIWFAHPHRGSLFVSRSRFRPRYSSDFIPMPDAWRAGDLPAMTGVRDDKEAGFAADMMATAVNWIGSYERWVGQQVEPDYRENILAEWQQRKRHKSGVPAAMMPESWFELAEQIVQEII